MNKVKERKIMILYQHSRVLFNILQLRVRRPDRRTRGLLRQVEGYHCRGHESEQEHLLRSVYTQGRQRHVHD